jgi:hypothetical protein
MQRYLGSAFWSHFAEVHKTNNRDVPSFDGIAKLHSANIKGQQKRGGIGLGGNWRDRFEHARTSMRRLVLSSPSRNEPANWVTVSLGRNIIVKPVKEILQFAYPL